MLPHTCNPSAWEVEAWGSGIRCHLQLSGELEHNLGWERSGFKPRTIGWGAYLPYQSEPGSPSLPKSLSVTGPFWLTHPSSKLFQLRGWAALPYIIQPFGYLVFFVYSLLLYLAPLSPFFFPSSSPHMAQGHVHPGISQMTLPLNMSVPLYPQ